MSGNPRFRISGVYNTSFLKSEIPTVKENEEIIVADKGSILLSGGSAPPDYFLYVEDLDAITNTLLSAREIELRNIKKDREILDILSFARKYKEFHPYNYSQTKERFVNFNWLFSHCKPLHFLLKDY